MEKETAMKILKELHDKSLFAERTALETIIPELKKSEDERIRRNIIAALKGEGYFDCDLTNECIAWLEKQGEQKPTEVRTTGYWNVKDIDQKPFDYEHATITQKDFASVGETATIELSSPIDCGDRIYHVSHKPIEKHGEQKHINDTDEEIVNAVKDTSVLDMVEPKFKVGDWVVTDKNDIVQIKAVNNDYYTIDNGMYFNMPYVDRCWHLWTVQDAKDGDVLVDKYGNIGIYQGDKNAVRWNSYCYCGVNKVFYDEGSHEFPCYPATKEQQDTLEKAMDDAGYTFDFEKKELKKPQRMISAEAKEALYYKVKPKFNIGDVLCDKSCTTLNKNSQPNIEILDIWNDMYICNNCSFPISQQDEYELVAKRIEPQSAAWSDEDDAYKEFAICAVEDFYDEENPLHKCIVDWLKSLKNRL